MNNSLCNAAKEILRWFRSARPWLRFNAAPGSPVCFATPRPLAGEACGRDQQNQREKISWDRPEALLASSRYQAVGWGATAVSILCHVTRSTKIDASRSLGDGVAGPPRSASCSWPGGQGRWLVGHFPGARHHQARLGTERGRGAPAETWAHSSAWQDRWREVPDFRWAQGCSAINSAAPARRSGHLTDSRCRARR